MIITIDGPAASGKTTIGKLLASRLKYEYLYSGFLYRAVAYVLIQYGKYTTDQLSVISVESVHTILEEVPIEYRFIPGGNCSVLISGDEITESILMTPAMDNASSMLGLNKSIRTLLTDTQRILVDGRNVVVDGRDAGSVVFPNADYKFFLTASVSARASRYVHRQQKQGCVLSVHDAERIITERDNRDNHWLTVVNGMKDIVIIDTSSINQEEVVNLVMQRIALKK